MSHSGNAARASTRMTKKELFAELNEARRRIRTLERVAAERERSDEVFREVDQRLSAIADNLPGIVYRRINHSDGQVSYPYISARHEALLGLESDKVKTDPTHPMRMTHPDDRDAWHEAISEATRNLTPLDAERRVITASGEIRSVRSIAQTHRLDNGDVVFDGIILDVTDRRDAERAQNEARLRAITANLPGTVYRRILHPDGRLAFDYVSEGDTGFLELDEGESTADFESFLNTIHPEHRDQFLAALQDSAKNLTTMSLDLRHVLSDGRIRWMRTISRPFRTEAGEVVWDGVAFEVTAQKEAEEALQASEARFRKVLAEIADAVITIDEDSRIELFNQVAERMFGYRSEEVVGEPVSMLMPEPEQAQHRGAVANYLATGEAKFLGHGPREVTARRKDGSTFPMALAVSEMHVGERRAFIGAMRDVTESKRAREALRDSEALFRSVVENAPNAIYLKDRAERFTLVNRRFCELYGYSADELLGKTAKEFFEPELASRISAQDHAVMQRRGTVEAENAVPHADGTVHDLIATKFPILEADGEAIGVGGMDIDITERKRAEEALRESEERLRAIADNLPGVVFRRIVHADGRASYPFISARCKEVMGFEPDEVHDDPEFLTRITHPDDRQSWVDTIAAALRDQTHVDIVRRLILPAGETKWFRTLMRPRRQANGDVVFDGLTLDVTEQREAEEAFQRSEGWLWAIVDNSPVSIALKDLDGRFILANEQTDQIFGVSTDAYLGRRSHDLLPRALAESLVAHDREVVETGRPVEREYQVVCEDGVHTVHTIKFPVLDPAAGMVAVGVISTDITERVWAEAARRESEARFRAVVNNSPNLIYLKDTEGRYLLVNDAFQRTMGWRHEDVVGKTAFDRAPEDHAMVFSDHDRAVIESRKTVVREEKVQRGDGSIRTHMATKFPIFDAGGELVAIGGINTDITDEKMAAEALRQSEERVRLIADALPVFIFYFDAGHRFQFANENYARLYERRPAELIGEKVEEVVGSARYDQIRPNMDRALAGEDHAFEFKVSYPDGTIRDLEYTYVAHLGPDGRVAGVYVMGTDVTDRNLAEEQLRQAQKMEAVGQLTGGIAHDFNNLLAVILGNAELAKEQLREDDSLNEYLDASTRAALRGAELTQRLLAFSRKQTLRPRALDLNILVAGMIAFLRRTLGETIEIDVRRSADLSMADADPGQLENALLNLAINARDAMPDGGTLTIETGNVEFGGELAAANPDFEPGPYVMLAVGDSGTGIPSEFIERVFDPFFTTKEVGEGTGLGLSMVYGFIRQSGGHVEIESEVGRGTAVRLYLPTTREGDAMAERAAGEEGEARGHGEVVLVVEDDEAVRELTMNVVDSLGYQVLGAGDATTGLDVLQEHADVSLLLTDIVLPGGTNGTELAEKARDRRPDLKVLFMSGYMEIAGGQAGRSIEEAELVRKPFRKSELAEKIRVVLDC